MQQDKKIQLNIDFTSRKAKPTNAEYAIIRKHIRRPGNQQQITIDILRRYIEGGHTFTPAVIEGDSEEWLRQEVICIDVDNGNENKIMLPEDALRISYNNMGSYPALIYKTFSYSEECPRFRIVFILSEILEDAKQAGQLMENLRYIFEREYEGATDPGSTQLTRMFLGSKPGCIIYPSEKRINVREYDITPIEVLEMLPEAPKKEEAPPPKAKTATSYGFGLRRLKDKLEADINRFDMRDYLRGEGLTFKRSGSTYFINPCPLCGHMNDFEVKQNGWVCYSASGAAYGRNGNRPGGSIITYLERVKKMTTAQALEHFKFNIMHYDRREWAREYAREKKEEERAQEMRKNEERIKRMLEGGSNNG